ncbi:protein kinase domain-containing protein [Streptomyces sp. JNUCC 64]
MGTKGDRGEVAGGAKSRLIGGRYLLRTRLGRGGMGTVWGAEDQLLGRFVAVKRLDSDPALRGAEARRVRARTLREARAVAALRHPNVVVVHDVVEHGDDAYIVMELVTGGSLADRVGADGPFPVGETARVGLALLGALSAAHTAGVLHRDLKPDNVLLEEDTGRVVLTDFGVARVPGSRTLSEEGVFVGSPEYSAPERMTGATGGPESDLWSLGALLCAVLTGHSPFRRDSISGTLHAVVAEEFRPPAQAGPLTPLVRGLLERDPARRLGTVDAERLLRAVLAGGRYGAPAHPATTDGTRLPAPPGAFPAPSGALPGAFPAPPGALPVPSAVPLADVLPFPAVPPAPSPVPAPGVVTPPPSPFPAPTVASGVPPTLGAPPAVTPGDPSSALPGAVPGVVPGAVPGVLPPARPSAVPSGARASAPGPAGGLPSGPGSPPPGQDAPASVPGTPASVPGTPPPGPGTSASGLGTPASGPGPLPPLSKTPSPGSMAPASGSEARPEDAPGAAPTAVAPVSVPHPVPSGGAGPGDRDPAISALTVVQARLPRGTVLAAVLVAAVAGAVVAGGVLLLDQGRYRDDSPVIAGPTVTETAAAAPAPLGTGPTSGPRAIPTDDDPRPRATERSLRPPRASRSPGGRPGASGAASAPAALAPASTPSAAPTRDADRGVPAGYRTVRDPEGFTLAVPAGFVRSRQGDWAVYASPDGTERLAVRVDAPHAGGPVPALSEEHARGKERRSPVTRATHRGLPAARWELTEPGRPKKGGGRYTADLAWQDETRLTLVRASSPADGAGRARAWLAVAAGTLRY